MFDFFCCCWWEERREKCDDKSSSVLSFYTEIEWEAGKRFRTRVYKNIRDLYKFIVIILLYSRGEDFKDVRMEMREKWNLLSGITGAFPVTSLFLRGKKKRMSRTSFLQNINSEAHSSSHGRWVLLLRSRYRLPSLTYTLVSIANEVIIILAWRCFRFKLLPLSYSNNWVYIR